MWNGRKEGARPGVWQRAPGVKEARRTQGLNNRDAMTNEWIISAGTWTSTPGLLFFYMILWEMRDDDFMLKISVRLQCKNIWVVYCIGGMFLISNILFFYLWCSFKFVFFFPIGLWWCVQADCQKKVQRTHLWVLLILIQGFRGIFIFKETRFWGLTVQGG